ncbi:MAG: peptide chain release factor N(5)-glutamine methyltransferase [Patescibacteria group bacterium]|nr:peptide chain release factor N(5)-glutamine methyltransferase [Patescibacteria group bacterium]
MTIKQIFSKYFPKLKSKSLSPLLDIEILLSRTLNKPKEYLYEYPEKKLSTKQLSLFKKLFSRRSKGEPIAYILGSKEFYDLNFKVNKNVLIPRPETEILVDEVINFVKAPSSKLQAPSIVDIGTGSGCIIISLAQNIKKANFYATEISSKALLLAKQNAKLNQVNIKFFKGNLLQPFSSELRARSSEPIITANLPYLTSRELKNSILKYEPRVALDGGQDGLKYFYELFDQIDKFKIKPRAIFLEIGWNQATKIKQMAKKVLPNYRFEIKKDLCGFDRAVVIKK